MANVQDPLKKYYNNKTQEIDLSGNAEVLQLDGLNTFVSVQKLYLRNTQITSLAKIEKLTHLINIDISGSPIKSFLPIQMLKRFLTIKAVGCQLDSLKGIENNLALLELDVQQNLIQQVAEISVLRNFRRLKTLNLLQNAVLDQPEFEAQFLQQNLRGLSQYNGAPIPEHVHKAFHPEAPVQTALLEGRNVSTIAYQQELKTFAMQYQLLAVGYCSSATGPIVCNENGTIRTNLLPVFNASHLLDQLGRNGVQIEDEFLTAIDHNELKKQITLKNPSNAAYQRGEMWVMPGEIYLVVRGRRKFEHEQELFARIRSVFSGFRFIDTELQYRRRAAQYSLQVVCFVSTEKLLTDLTIYLKPMLKMQQRVARCSFVAAASEGAQQLVESDLFTGVSILNELDAECFQYFEFQSQSHWYLVNDGKMIASGTWQEVWAKLKDLSGADELEQTPPPPAEYEEPYIKPTEKEKSEYSYEYIYEDEIEEKKSEPPASSKPPSQNKQGRNSKQKFAYGD